MSTFGQPSFDVFISYARADGRDIAQGLQSALNARGLNAWRDERNLNPYQDFSVMIERAIQRSNHVLVCLTPSIVQRDDSFVRREILYAQGRKKTITPLVCSGFKPEDIPITIVHLTWMQFQDLNSSISPLIERLKTPITDYEPPIMPYDPFREYVEQLRDFTVDELSKSLLNFEEMLLLHTLDTPSAVPARQMPVAFRPRSLRINQTISRDNMEFSNFDEAFLARKGRVLLLGTPGAGKTTTLLAFAREKANSRLVDPKVPLPVYAPIRNWDGITEVTEWVAKDTGLKSDDLRVEIETGRAVLILDGLDELGVKNSSPQDSADYRVKFIRKLVPVQTQLLVSCRVQDYDETVQIGDEKIALEGGLTLQPLEEEQIKSYLKDQPELWSALRADSELLEMARTPLLLTLLAIGYRDVNKEEREQLRDLAASPRLLRERIFRTYLKRRYEHEIMREERLPLELDELTIRLGQAAIRMTNDSSNGDSALLIPSHFEGNKSADTIALSERLHLIQAAEHNQWRFIHSLLRDYFISQVRSSSDPLVRKQAATAQRSLLSSARSQEFDYLNSRLRAFNEHERLYMALSSSYSVNMRYNAETLKFDKLEDAISQFNSRLVLIGEPGSGKTTALRHVMINAIKAYLDNPVEHRLPMWINLGNSANPVDTTTLLQYWWDEQYYLPGTAGQYISQDNLSLFIDGLNEIPIDKRNQQLRNLRQFVDQFPNLPIIATCRQYDYADDSEFDLGLPVVRIQPLNASQISEFLRKQIVDEGFEKSIMENDSLRQLGKNPYYLTMLVAVYKGTGQFPNNLNSLFRIFVETKYRDSITRSQLSQTPLLKLRLPELEHKLRQLAYRMMVDSKGTSVDITWARRLIGRDALNDAISLGILVRDEGAIAFYHQSLHSYYGTKLLVDALSEHRVGNRIRNIFGSNKVTLIQQIGNLGKSGIPAVEALIQSLDDQDINVQMGAAEALEKIGTPEAIKAAENWRNRRKM